jgi:colanic acid biosynthesis glycosyl transferase WcaI
MRRPTILFMNRVYPPVRGATGRVLRDLARSFAREGWHVTVITTGPKAAKERDGAIHVIRVKGPEKPKGVFSYGWIWLKMLIAAMRQPPRHLVVTMSDPPLVVKAGQIVANATKARHMHWCHDLYPDLLPALGMKIPGFAMDFFKNISREALDSCEKVIVVGRCMAKHLSVDGIDPRKITVIPNWPDFELMRPADGGPPAPANGNGAVVEAEEIAKPGDELLKTGPKFRVLYAGNIGLAHPVQTILDAAELLHDEHPEIEFVFVGDGGRFDDLAQERSRRGLDNIRLLPYQPSSKLRELMESGDVHLISMNDAAAGCLVPSKLYAALAVQRPTIFVGPEQSETAKVIKDFNAGVVVAQGNAHDLAHFIKTFRMSSEHWFEAQSGAASAAQIFVPRESIEAWMDRAWSVVESDLAAQSKRAA